MAARRKAQREFRRDYTEDLEHTQDRHARQERRRRTPPTSPERPQHAPQPVSTYTVRAVEAARTDLFATMTRAENSIEPKTVALNIATAQRLVLADMQHNIAVLTEAVLGESLGMLHIEVLGDSVKEYCRSVRIAVVMEHCD